jgi:peroxiredoxin
VALREKYSEIRALGADLVAISPQLERFNQELAKERKLPFPVLGDLRNEVARKYNVAFTLPDSMKWVYREIFKLNLPEFNGDDSWTLPMPARFIVDKRSIIVAADVNLDHTVRPEPETALDALKNLRP